MSTQYVLNAAKFDYEFMGKAAEAVAQEYNLPTYLVNAEVEAGTWVRRIEPTSLPVATDIKQFAEDLSKITRSKLTVISLFRQIDNQPLYASLEKAVLDKLLKLVDQIHLLDDKAASKLQSIAKTLETIQTRDPITLADKAQDALKSGATVQVLIQNTLDDAPKEVH